MQWLLTGFGQIFEFIAHLEMVTTSNSSTIPNSLQHALPSQSAVFTGCRLVKASNAVDPSTSFSTAPVLVRCHVLHN
jgi:hypothetical protein